MAKKIINIKLEDSIWRQAKAQASLQGMTLQDWLTLAILRMSTDKVEVKSE